MEAAAVLSLPSPSTSSHPRLSSLSLTRPFNPFVAPSTARTPTTRPAVVRAAISRSKKETTVETVKTHLENCHFLAGIKYQGLTVKQLQELRRSLPETTKLVVAKNTLVFKAIEGTPWEALKPCMKGMNAWLFVQSDEVPAAIKPYRAFQKEKKLENNDFAGAVFEGKFYGPDEFNLLETMPSRADIYAKLLGSIQTPAIGLVTTLQAPARDVVMVLKAYVQKLEDQAGEQ